MYIHAISLRLRIQLSIEHMLVFFCFLLFFRICFRPIHLFDILCIIRFSLMLLSDLLLFFLGLLYNFKPRKFIIWQFQIWLIRQTLNRVILDFQSGFSILFDFQFNFSFSTNVILIMSINIVSVYRPFERADFLKTSLPFFQSQRFVLLVVLL
jgi:hypothetical protein